MEDTLAQWLYKRFSQTRHTVPWDRLTESDQDYWIHEAKATRRAVMRGGFKDNFRSFARMETDTDRYIENDETENAYYNGVEAVLDAMYTFVNLECME